MKPLIRWTLVLLLPLFTSAPLFSAQASEKRSSKETFVLVHGAWGGGWAWKEVDRLLEAEGHTVYRVTLTGNGEKRHLASPEVGLSTHIEDVVNVILWENLEDVVLVGHSYGGMVVTGVADQIPDRISRMFYIDALVPENGESLHAAFGRNRETPGRSEGGFSVPPWVPEDAPIPHDVPHSLKCFSETLELTNSARLDLPTAYLLTVDPGLRPEEDTFYPFFRRARALGWTVIVREGWDHNPQWSHPQELAELLR